MVRIVTTAGFTADATERYDESDPVNPGSGMEIAIKHLTETIAGVTGFDGDIERDTSTPDGQVRRKLDVSRARERFSWEASTAFEDGLEETVEWYETNRRVIVDD